MAPGSTRVVKPRTGMGLDGDPGTALLS